MRTECRRWKMDFVLLSLTFTKESKSKELLQEQNMFCRLILFLDSIEKYFSIKICTAQNK